jgi:hypothetical protein
MLETVKVKYPAISDFVSAMGLVANVAIFFCHNLTEKFLLQTIRFAVSSEN